MTAEPNRVLCAGGCGTLVSTAKCTPCAERAVAEWLRARDARGAETAARYYR